MDTIQTSRLLLRRWRDEDRAPFAAMNSDLEVMHHFPRPLRREKSAAMVDRIEAQFERTGYGLWAVEHLSTCAFIGFVGISDVPFDAPFTPAVEIGWRLARDAWGQGFATEAATTVVHAAFGELDLTERISFAVPANSASRAVMRRIGMAHDPQGDFDHPNLAEDSPHRRHVLYRLRRT